MLNNQINKNLKPKRLFSQITPLAIASTAIIGNILPAQALSFNFTYDIGVNTQQKEAFEFAGRYWSDFLNDDATVNIHVDFAATSKMSRNVNGTTQTALAGAIPNFLNPTVANVWSGITNDLNKSADDITAINANQFYTIAGASTAHPDGLVWTNFLNPYQAIAAGFSSSKMSITRANAKAIGLLAKNDSALDGVILVNNLDSLINNVQYGWYNSAYQRSATNTSTQFDLTTVAVHEIGHVLGFISSLEAATNFNTYWNMAFRENAVTPFDIFRSTTRRTSLTNAGADLSHGGTSYFSLDNGLTSLGLLSTGVDVSDGVYQTLPNFKGDGYQGSHWKQDNSLTYKNSYNLGNVNRGLGVMAAALATGNRREFSNLDLTVMDVIGWERKNSTKSFSTIEWEAKMAAATKGNVNRNVEVANMYNQSRWGGGSTGSTFGQVTDLADYFAQQGIFQIGSFWDSLEESTDTVSVPEPGTNAGLLSLGLFALGALKKRQLKSQR